MNSPSNFTRAGSISTRGQGIGTGNNSQSGQSQANTGLTSSRDSSSQRKVQTPISGMFHKNSSSSDFSIKDKINEINQKTNNLNLALDTRLKDRKNKEDMIINNILNADNYRFKSNMFSGINSIDPYKNEQGKLNLLLYRYSTKVKPK